MRINGATTSLVDLDDLISEIQGSCPCPFSYAPEGTGSTRSSDAAEMIGQGQAGFSTDVPLGTRNIGACVAIIARNVETGTTSLIHADRGTSKNSIDKALDDLGSGSLQVALLGARYCPGAERPTSEIADSRGNIAKVLEALKDRDCNIVAARIQDAMSIDEVLATTNIYVDPKTLSITSEHQERPASDPMLAYAKPIISGGSNSIDLDVVFDDRREQARMPVLLREQDVAALNSHVHGKVDHEVSDWFVARGFSTDPNWLSTCVALVRGWSELHRSAVSSLAATVGCAEHHLESRSLYVGVGSEEANLQLARSNNTPSRPQVGSRPTGPSHQ